MPGQFTGNRGEAQSYLSGLIKEGYNNVEIVGFLQSSGLGYRTSNMYSDVNRTRLEIFGGQGLKGFDVDTPIPNNMMREWQGETNYKYRVVVQYKYSSTGATQQFETGTTLYYDEQPTLNQVLEDFATRTQTIESGYGSAQGVSRIDEIKEINYFYNTPKR